MVPAAKAVQKLVLPSNSKKGSKPRMVEMVVRNTGIILRLKALR